MVEDLVTAAELAAAIDWPAGSDTTELEQVAGAANVVVCRYLDPNLGPHAAHPNDKEAALAVAVQIYTTRTAPGGQTQSIDYQPVMVPHLLGPGLAARIQGLITPCRAYGGLVIG
jgi:hypothetical protein